MSHHFVFTNGFSVLIPSGSERFSRFQCSRTAILYGSAFLCSASVCAQSRPALVAERDEHELGQHVADQQLVLVAEPLAPDRTCPVARAEAVGDKTLDHLDAWPAALLEAVPHAVHEQEAQPLLLERLRRHRLLHRVTVEARPLLELLHAPLLVRRRLVMRRRQRLRRPRSGQARRPHRLRRPSPPSLWETWTACPAGALSLRNSRPTMETQGPLSFALHQLHGKPRPRSRCRRLDWTQGHPRRHPARRHSRHRPRTHASNSPPFLIIEFGVYSLARGPLAFFCRDFSRAAPTQAGCSRAKAGTVALRANFNWRAKSTIRPRP